jgi:co-chaperonin GroES (HSP10)
MKAIGNYIWIRPEELKEEKTESGILLAMAKPIPQTGTVEHIGTKCDMDLLESEVGPVEIGTKVLFDKGHIRRAGDNNEYIIIPDKNILAIIE